MGIRDDARAHTTAQILAAARAAVAEHGGGGLSMRAIAREVGLVSSAVYRYFPTREALLTAMIIESYGNLSDALAQVSAPSPGQHWQQLAHAFRDWAIAHRHEFQLIYGTPVPGYIAPAETIPAAEGVVRHFLAAAGSRSVDSFAQEDVEAQLAGPAASFGCHPAGMAAVLAELAALVGFIGLELAGHFIGTADPADAVFHALVNRQVESLGLSHGESD